MRLRRVLIAVLAGAVVGAAGLLLLDREPQSDPGARPAPGATDGGARTGAPEDSTTQGPATGRPDGAASPRPDESPPATPSPSPQPQAPDGLLLLWTPGGLPHDLAGRLDGLTGLESVTIVRGDLVELADGDWRVPLDAIAFDPATYPDHVPVEHRGQLADLGDGEALLGATSAGLRDAGPGDTLELADGSALTVAGVVDDRAVGAAEIAVTRSTGRRIGVGTDRFALLTHDDAREDVETRLRDRLPGDAPARIRAPGETPYLRHGDAVLPQAIVKARYGEFAYRRRSGDRIEQEPAWRSAELAVDDVPILGEVRCHRAILPALDEALGQLVDRGLGHLVDAGGFGGCHHPRMTRSGDAVSRHAWGIAVDLNVDANPVGSPGDQDERLVETMQAHGFGWGGEWLIPDPHHFEYVSW